MSRTISSTISRGVVGAGLLAQLGVVLVEEPFVQVQVGVAAAPPDPVPLHLVDDADQQVRGDLELPGHPVGEQLQRGPHQRVAGAELLARSVQAAPGEADALGAGQQQRERDGLGIPVGEHPIGGVREQQFAPVSRQPKERLLLSLLPRRDATPLQRQLVQHLVAAAGSAARPRAQAPTPT